MSYMITSRILAPVCNRFAIPHLTPKAAELRLHKSISIEEWSSLTLSGLIVGMKRMLIDQTAQGYRAASMQLNGDLSIDLRDISLLADVDCFQR